jgi:hypothetical protein
MQMAQRLGLKWDRAAEERQVNERIASAYHNLFEKNYDPTTGVIPGWLPMEFHTQWAAILAEGRRPTIMRNGAGWHVRRAKEAGETNGENGNGAAHNGANGKDEEPQSAPAVPFVLRSFVPFDPAALPPAIPFREALPTPDHGWDGRPRWHGEIQPGNGRRRLDGDGA